MIRIGIGYDIHRLATGRALILGGIVIPHDKGLDAHSDGDVLCHALCDALLGAAGLPNIGVLFPDTDPRWKNADSLALLGEVVRVLDEAGFVPVQVDTNVIAEKPKLQPHVSAIRERIAACLNVPPGCVSVKPRTNETCGPEGREEAISAHAVVVIQENSQAQ